jgi:hypothetical protein
MSLIILVEAVQMHQWWKGRQFQDCCLQMIWPSTTGSFVANGLQKGIDQVVKYGGKGTELRIK